MGVVRVENWAAHSEQLFAAGGSRQAQAENSGSHGNSGRSGERLGAAKVHLVGNWWFALDLANPRLVDSMPHLFLIADLVGRIQYAGGIRLESHVRTGTGNLCDEMFLDGIDWINPRNVSHGTMAS